MLRRARGVLRRHAALLWVFGILLGMGLLVHLFPVQALGRARVGVAGTLVSKPGHPVTLAVALPAEYGLTAEERREGTPALNRGRRAEVVLEGSTFVAELPPVLYCSHRFSWRPLPPPPAWFVLRFSDAPDEEYVVWRSGKRSGVHVTTPDGVEVRSDMVSLEGRAGRVSLRGPRGSRDAVAAGHPPRASAVGPLGRKEDDVGHLAESAGRLIGATDGVRLPRPCRPSPIPSVGSSGA